MPIGNVLVDLGVVLALAGIVTSFLHIRNKEDNLLRASQLIVLSLFAILTIALAYLYYMFITTDVSAEYVWAHTHIDHPMKYKISGVIAGKEGSLLFWVWMVIAPWFYEEMKARKKEVDPKVLAWTRIGVLGVLAVLLYVLSGHEMFSLTPSNLLASSPDGMGLNPLLQTDLMAIHPPIVFVAYGFMAIPLAAGFAYFLTGKKDWIPLSINWSRAGWLFLTLGIGIGALWAYVVLGWGGYWAWDPVETSSFLPWLLLTGFMHAILMNKRKNHYKIMAPLLGIFTFILVIFATFATRAGGLWVSVHSFGAADVSVSPMDRLWGLVTTEESIAIYFAFMVVASVLAIFLALRRRNMDMDEDRTEKYFTLSDMISDNILMLATIVLLGLMTFVTMLILVFGMNGLSPDDFDRDVGLLTIVLVLAMAFCLLWRALGKKRVTILAGLAVFVSVIGMFAFPEHKMVAGTIPILVVALFGSGYQIVKSYNPRRIRSSLSVISAHLVHFAMILLIIGYVGSNFMVTEETLTLSLGGQGEDIGVYSLFASDYEATTDSIYIEVEVWKGDEFMGMENPGLVLIDGQTRSEIRVVGTATEDVYLSYQEAYTDNMGRVTDADINVKVIPLMKLVWGGMWLMSIGIVLRLLMEKIPSKKKEEDEHPLEEEPETSEARDDSYYDKLVEEELAKMESTDADHTTDDVASVDIPTEET